MHNTESLAREIRRLVAQRRPETLATLKELVAIDSGSYDPPGVDRAGDVLEREWRSLGFSCERHPLAGYGARRLFRRRFGGRGRILIVGHLDTVWPAGACDDWSYAEVDGLAFGPGVGDMKGGLVMACEAVRALLQSGFDAAAEIRHILVPDEELGSAGSRAWIEDQARGADAVLVLEPARADGSVVAARGSVGALVVRARGVSAHTMHLREGASALRVLADRVASLEDLTDIEQGTLVNVGVLNGGDARQVVPAAAEMHVDLRARSDSAAAALLSRVINILQAPSDPRVTIEISGGITRPAFPRAASEVLLATASRAAAALGIRYPAVESGGGSDGSFAAALGRPTLDGLGPVCLDPCSRRERIVIDSLFDRAAILGSLMANLPGPAPSLSTGEASWV
jgi:acetylornithine deacetylase/succinyl-diaminopimelate desuccinylase-like protein